jgi:oligo-1,6-glucosidase
VHWLTFSIKSQKYRIFIENHDQARAVSRFGDDATEEHRTLSSKMLAIFECTQSGTLYVYQGLELGMKNFPRTWGIEEYKDVASINYYNRRVILMPTPSAFHRFAAY